MDYSESPKSTETEKIDVNLSSIDQKDSGSESNSNLWDEIGFHRPLAGFWYNFAITIFHMATASLATILLFPIMFPFPQIDGYYRAATGVFAAVYLAFDLGTANMMARYIGETNIKNPKKMIEYIQYFIWYQMFSGLIQVTGIAIWAIYFPPENLIFLVWIMIIYSTTQYPAMQGVFKSVLQSLQQFDKSAIISFVQGDVIQRFTEIGFVILFRYTIGQNPKIGIILACAIGLCLGKYLDDFIAMAIGMKFFKKLMKVYDISVKDCFRHDFDRNLVKECFTFGIKTGFPGVINGFVGLLILTWWLNIPQYTTFIALMALAQSIVNFVQGLKVDLGGAISESYLNDKKSLCQFYIGQCWRFDGLIQIMIYSILIVVTFLLEPALLLIGLDGYILAVPFIIPTLIRRFTIPYEQLGAEIITGTNNPNANFAIDIGSMVLNFISWWFILVVLKLPQTYGIAIVVWIMPMGDFVTALVKLVVTYIYINKKVLKLKIPWYQTFGGPTISGTIIVILGILYMQLIFMPISSVSIVAGLLIGMIIFFFGMPFFYILLTVFLGVWDDSSLDSFKKASDMAGIARFITKPMYKILLWATPKSKLHNRFSVDDSKALEEALELMEIKRSNMAANNLEL